MRLPIPRVSERWEQNQISGALKVGAGISIIELAMFASYEVGFWYGSKCVIASNYCPLRIIVNRYTPGDVLVVFFSVLMAGFYFTQVGPSIEKITQRRNAAARIFGILDR